MNDVIFHRLLLRSVGALSLCALLVTVCYFWVDRPVAFFVASHEFGHYRLLKWLTYPPPIIQTLAPGVMAVLMIRRGFGPFSRWERTLLAACVSLLITVQFKDTLKYLFGRDWPDTWIDNNPSLLRNDAYGFHPFHGDNAFGSFPSGHTARTLAIVSIYWIASPRWRWLGVLATVAVAVGLIGMDYHFVGDVIAGGFVGGIVGMYVAQFFGHDAGCPS
jgi:membrane-associated phospholipid phosphatase